MGKITVFTIFQNKQIINNRKKHSCLHKKTGEAHLLLRSPDGYYQPLDMNEKEKVADFTTYPQKYCILQTNFCQ